MSDEKKAFTNDLIRQQMQKILREESAAVLLEKKDEIVRRAEARLKAEGIDPRLGEKSEPQA